MKAKILGKALYPVMIIAGLGAGSASAGQIITAGNGVQVGVFDAGSIGDLGRGLYAPFATGGSPTGDAILPGCLCEGWGMAGNGVQGNVYAGAPAGVTVDGTVSTATTFTSNAHLNSLSDLTISQEYSPSSTPNFVMDKVTITNTSASTITDVRYARNMDWDIPPTNFNEWVTIQGWPATALLHSSDDGFATSDPLSAASSICTGAVVDGNFTEVGPCDHGAWFDFGFGDLAAGASTTFNIFYGAAPNKADAMTALGDIGAEVYSLGYSTSSAASAPNTSSATFIFAFTGVGGTPVTPTPEPASLALMGLGLAGVAAARRRRKA